MAINEYEKQLWFLLETTDNPMILVAYAKNKFTDVCALYISRNHNCPESILRMLARIENYYLRMNIIYNPKCPEDVLRMLAKSTDFFVRRSAIIKLRKQRFGKIWKG
jgi:hypothetical protein